MAKCLILYTCDNATEKNWIKDENTFCSYMYQQKTSSYVQFSYKNLLLIFLNGFFPFVQRWTKIFILFYIVKVET